MPDGNRLLLFNRYSTVFIYTIYFCNISGIGLCFLLVCLYLFVAIAKVFRAEQLSSLFHTAEESGQIYQALELKRQTNCKIWQLNKKSLLLIQDSHLVAGNKLGKERVKNGQLVR